LSTTAPRRRRTPAALREALARAGREHSDATVIFHSTIARRLALNPTDYKTLGVLQRLGPMSAGEIAKHTGLATASVTSLVDRLEGKGFVRRTHDAKDRRRVMVTAVADRVADAPRIFASTRRSLARLFDRYSEAELAVIADFLTRNAERLRLETRKIEGRTRA
jgi:DNA-binding MarR family transcriptional regulator